MKNVTSWLVLLIVSMMLAGCGSSIEEGIPAGTTGGLDFSKTTDPMLNPNMKDPISQKAAKQAAKKAR